MKTETKTIPFFDYPHLYLFQKEKLDQIIQETLSRGAYILQKDLQEFEDNLAAFLKVKHVIGVANGTDGLIMLLRAAGIGPGDEVIFPSHTFVATASAIYFVGAGGVPVECGADHLIEPISVEKAITSKTKAIIPVQLNGRTCNMDPILALARKYNLKIVEDSAQALGSSFKGRFAGTFGAGGMFSFYPAKTLGCFGDGGAVVTNDDSIAEQLHLARDHGRDAAGDVVAWGINSRLDNLQAAILNFYLKQYPQSIQRRREIAGIYNENLKEISDLVLPPAPGSDPDHFDIFQNYEIESSYRDTLKKFLEENGVRTLLQWGGSAVHQFKELGFKQNLPITDELTARFMLLPMNLSLTDEDVIYICDQIKRFYEKNL